MRSSPATTARLPADPLRGTLSLGAAQKRPGYRGRCFGHHHRQRRASGPRACASRHRSLLHLRAAGAGRYTGRPAAPGPTRDSARGARALPLFPARRLRGAEAQRLDRHGAPDDEAGRRRMPLRNRRAPSRLARMTRAIAFELIFNVLVVPDAMEHAMLLRRSGTRGQTWGILADRSRVCGAPLRAAPRQG